jgi:hypothetical protein
MARKRRLQDLYVTGAEVTFDDGTGDPITVYVRKLNAVEHETALKHANAARARAMAVLKDRDSIDYQDIWSDAQDLDRDSLERYLADEERANRIAVVEAELSQEDEWAEDGYLDGLQEAWGELEATYFEDPEDEEAKRVFGELKRFSDQVKKEIEAHVDNLLADLEGVPDDTLRERVLKKNVQMRASMAWITTFRRAELWLAVREKDRKTRYFDKFEDLEDLSDAVLSRLAGTYKDISVDPTEGKGSRAKGDSSVSSD